MPHLLKVLEHPAVNGVFFKGLDKPFHHTVSLWLRDEGETWGYPQKRFCWRRLLDLDTCQPTHSAFQCFTVPKSQTQQSLAFNLRVPSVPHMILGGDNDVSLTWVCPGDHNKGRAAYAPA